MKFKIKKLLCVCSCIMLVFCISAPGYAATKTATGTSKKMAFPVNNGGWSYINFVQTYNENYTKPNSSVMKLSSRERIVVAKVAAATQSPKLDVVVAHFNSGGSAVKYFTSWSKISIVYDGSTYNSGSGYKNTEQRTYNISSGYYGQMATSASCSGSTVTYQPVVSKIYFK